MIKFLVLLMLICGSVQAEEILSATEEEQLLAEIEIVSPTVVVETTLIEQYESRIADLEAQVAACDKSTLINNFKRAIAQRDKTIKTFQAVLNQQDRYYEQMIADLPSSASSEDVKAALDVLYKERKGNVDKLQLKLAEEKTKHLKPEEAGQ